MPEDPGDQYSDDPDPGEPIPGAPGHSERGDFDHCVGEQFVIDTLLSGRPAVVSSLVDVDAGDDTAVLTDGTLVTTDTMVEGVHWDHRATAEDVGWKLVAVNVSDVAAMGGRPTWATLSVCLPRPLDCVWIEGFARGLHAACAKWGVQLIGGDTTRSPGPAVVSLTLAGRASRPLTRSGACPGDDIWVTGVPGTAAMGFHHGGPGLHALHRPDPPVELAVALAASGCVSAAMDLSDGLATDLPRLCRRSGVGAQIDPTALPSNAILVSPPDSLAEAMAFGDDYELLFTAKPADRPAVLQLAQAAGVRVTAIGRITAGSSVGLVGQAWPTPGFAHFTSVAEPRP